MNGCLFPGRQNCGMSTEGSGFGGGPNSSGTPAFFCACLRVFFMSVAPEPVVLLYLQSGILKTRRDFQNNLP